MASSWSSVSEKPKRAQNSAKLPACATSGSVVATARLAAIRMSCSAIILMRSLIFALRACQATPPSLSNMTSVESLP